MTRTSQKIDEKLIEFGKTILIKDGPRAISIRSICKDNNINLGMFVYYFKSKNNFIKILVESFFRDMENMLFSECDNVYDYKEKMRRVILVTIKVFREKKGTLEKIIEDIDHADKVFADLHNSLQERQKKLFMDLIEGCKKAGYIEPSLEFEKCASIFVGGIMFYAKIMEHSFNLDAEQYFKKINEMMDFLFLKLAPPPRKKAIHNSQCEL